ncbi:hypothetical protein HanIR_Chr08g0351231 [Helianthus annuus]|nr:hypothetical protein HanIR_Chr08g0351231 [Helianthus annuus]
MVLTVWFFRIVHEFGFQMQSDDVWKESAFEYFKCKVLTFERRIGLNILSVPL